MEGIVQKLPDRKRPTDTMDHRMALIEKHNQTKALSSANNRLSLDFVLGTVTYRDENGIVTRISDGEKDTFYDTDGNVTRIMSGTKDQIFDGANEVVRLGDLS